MIRFRNPGTQYSTQIQVIKHLYSELKDKESFTIEDMAIVIAKGSLMTAYGYAGDAALQLSKTDQSSMNSALMNAKMYAEVFRMLGWVTPYTENKSYPLVFTYIGVHVALSSGDISDLYEQCVLGINNPTELIEKAHYNEKLRFFKCALRSFIDLGGIMYKHELCLGPMSVNDVNENEYQSMIRYIKTIRGNYSNLSQAFENLARKLNMGTTPVDNCTRFPIALMKSCEWVETETNYSLYNKNLKCLKITQKGIQTYEKIKNMYDLRLEEFRTLDHSKRESFIRLGIYSMLIRGGFDLSKISSEIENDRLQCMPIIGDKELLFSPYQTIRRSEIEKALKINLSGETVSNLNLDTFSSKVSKRNELYDIQKWELNLNDNAAMELLKNEEDLAFLKQVNKLISQGMNSQEIVEYLFNYYKEATQTTFYPLIATLFKIMGFKCSFSRPGDNGSRWDAIIDIPGKSIPIEIKSPTEEQHLSIKAIRQALENKIVLLSRKTYLTDPNVSTLAIGYYPPNKRAEVYGLISDFEHTYGYHVGVIDFKSLLSLAISILVDQKGFKKDKLFKLKGAIDASI